MGKEYISIKEFAERANISRQGAYKIINKKFQNYCKIIENKKYIDISAVEELKKVGDKSCQFGDKIVYGDCQLGDKTVALSLQQGHVSVDNHTFQPGDKTVDKIIDALNEQLKVKDKQIEIKDNQLAKKDEQIFEMQNIIKSLQEQQVSLTKSLANSQALHAGTIQEHIESKIEKGSKKGFWSWLFRKRN